MIYLGDDKIGKIYLGEDKIGKIYLGSNLVYQSGPPPAPEFYDKLVFDGTAYIDTGIIPTYDGAIVSVLGGETKKGQQNIFITPGYGGSVGGYRLYWGGNTNANRRQPIGFYQTNSYLFNSPNITNWNELRFALGAKGLMYNNNIITYNKGSLAANSTLLIGGVAGSSLSAFSGYMRTFYFYGSDTANVTSYADFQNYTPIYTLRPCLYGGKAGFWCVETDTFRGNSAESGTLTVLNDN